MGLAVTIKEEGTILEHARLNYSIQGIVHGQGRGLNFPLDLDFGIKGWDEGCLGQGAIGKVKDLRRIVCCHLF